jgi:hypothetical protein
MFPLTGNCIFVLLVGSLPDECHSRKACPTQHSETLEPILRSPHKAVPTEVVTCCVEEIRNLTVSYRGENNFPG